MFSKHSYCTLLSTTEPYSFRDWAIPSPWHQFPLLAHQANHRIQSCTESEVQEHREMGKGNTSQIPPEACSLLRELTGKTNFLYLFHTLFG